MCLFTRSVASAPARWFSEIPNMIRDPKSFQTLLADVRRFTRERCMPLEEQIDASDEMPPVLVTEMQQLGLFGHSIPAQYGGAGLTTEELALVNIEVSQCSPTFRARFGGNTGIAAESLIADRTEAQKQHYLPQLCSLTTQSSPSRHAVDWREIASEPASARSVRNNRSPHRWPNASSPMRRSPTCSPCLPAPT